VLRPVVRGLGLGSKTYVVYLYIRVDWRSLAIDARLEKHIALEDTRIYGGWMLPCCQYVDVKALLVRV
jgi:hypothetical protein